MRVVLAEDDLLVRQGVEALLATQPGIEVVASCEDLPSLLEAVAERRPDLVLTDVRMPPDHTDEGIRAAALIAREQPEVGVVVLSQYDDPQYAIRLLEDGSARRGYLLKERVSSVSHLVEALRKVAEGGSWVDPKIIDRLVEAKRPADSPLNWLTARETEVLAAVAQGQDNGAIADTLSITVRSVEKHINSIFAKLHLSEAVGVSKRVAAALTYLREVDA